MIWYLFLFYFVQIEEISCQINYVAYPPVQIQMPAYLPGALDNIMQGDTNLFGSMHSICTCVVRSQWTPDNQYEILLNNGINSLLNDRLIVGALTQKHFIGTVTLAFYDNNHNILRDTNGGSLEFVGSPDEFGHIFDSLPLGIQYSFIRIFLHPRGAERFDPGHIFFHWGYRLPWPRPTAEEETDGSEEAETDNTGLQDAINDPASVNGLINSTGTENTASPDLERRDCFLSALTQLDPSNNGTVNGTNCNSNGTNGTVTGIDYQGQKIVMVQGIWNTTAGSECKMARPGFGAGKYLPGKPPVGVFDDNMDTSYLSFGACGGTSNAGLKNCGLNTGFYFMFNGSGRLLKNFKIRSGKRSLYRDPKKVTIEGSNEDLEDLCDASSWVLLYNGKSGLGSKIGRKQWGTQIQLSKNQVTYQSYRFLVTEKRGWSVGVEYGDVKFHF